MTAEDKAAARKERQRLNRWLERMLASYIGDVTRADRTQAEASSQLHDLAMFDPTTFWEFIEYVSASQAPVERLRGLGQFGLYYLVRQEPDYYDVRVAALVRDDERFRHLIREVDPDRIAPDVWRKIETGLRGEQIKE